MYTTYLYTPDLSHETNPVVKYLGAGWTGTILLQVAVILLIIGCLYYYLFKFKPVKPDTKRLSFKEYISFINFGRTDSFEKVFYKTPTNKNLLLGSAGYIISMILIVVSFIVGTSTSFLLLSERYKSLYKHGGPYILYLIILLLAVFFTIRFYKLQYEQYQEH
jgi:H+/gluconate symporter-like permease